MTHSLEFLNPTYHDGLNVTVRRGEKWYLQARVGDTVCLCKTGENHSPLAVGMIVGLKYEPFLSIRKDDLTFEHDPTCTDIDGLMRAMTNAYPDFKETERVTVMSFWIFGGE